MWSEARYGMHLTAAGKRAFPLLAPRHGHGSSAVAKGPGRALLSARCPAGAAVPKAPGRNVQVAVAQAVCFVPVPLCEGAAPLP